MTTTWRPGLPVLTPEDRAAWEQWRKDSKREAQRWRRARYRRIDFYPEDLAAEVIDNECGPFVGGDYSGVISRIVIEWARATGKLPPE